MLTRDGEIVPIPGEKILFTSRPRVALELSTPKELQTTETFSFKSGDGIAYITNERVSTQISSPPPLQFWDRGHSEALMKRSLPYTLVL